MATYNNKHWLLSHVRNSFISTDDTGMCEAVMLSEDLPSQYIQAQKGIATNPAAMSHSTSRSSATTTNPPTDDYSSYPGLDQSDDEDAMDPLSQSYDVQMDQGISFIQRSNTAQKLDKMNLARKRASKIKNVKCDDTNLPVVPDTDTTALFVRKEVLPALNGDRRSSHLASQLVKYPKQPQNRFLQYARFDGTAQVSISTKTIKIFLTMLPEKQRNYPMEVCVTATAKIQEFIGLICYKCSLAYPETSLLSVRNYGLYITEEDGEIDMDFPPLDLREPCSKFCFSHLALVERKPADVRQDATRTMSLTSEIEAIQERLLEESHLANMQQSEDLARMLGHTTMMEAPLYRSYRLQIFTKGGFFRTNIQLGISSEKLEIDPVQQQKTLFWSHQKAISHCMDSVVWCEIIDEPSPNRSFIRLIYSQSHISDAQLTATPTIAAREAAAAAQAANAFHSYHFVTDRAMANEIVEKVRNIIEVRSSPARREYMARHTNKAWSTSTDANTTTESATKKKKPFRKKTFIFK